MKIVKFKGGLGNQMFQYAFAKLLEKRTCETVKLDMSAYASLRNDNVRKPRVEKFNLSLQQVTESEKKSVVLFKQRGNSLSLFYKARVFFESKLNKRYFFERNRAFIDPAQIIKYNYYDGYFQSWRYVKEVEQEVKQEFIPVHELSKNSQLVKEKMLRENSVFIGVRKGDYTSDKNSVAHYGAFTNEYYLRAMDIIAEKVSDPVFYIFSNDVNWCKNNIDWGKHNVIYREADEQTDDFEELILMSSCKHAIIVNSTYHWWGAYLINNDEKIVVAPKRWFFDDSPIDIVPPEWIRVDN